MAVVSVASGTQTAVINTEHSLAQLTGVGIYVAEVDLSELDAGDTVELRLKTTVLPEEDTKVALLDTFTGVQDVKNHHMVPLPLATGNEVVLTLTQTAGSARSFPWNLMRM